MTEITRHFVEVAGRMVHYRRCGAGPAVLMVHQSPRSSAEYEGLMREWGKTHCCIAPDTAGFGHSDPLPDADADIDDFSDALIGFCDAIGLHRTAAYGFHSGGIILANTLRRHAQRFTAVAIGGYALWTEDEAKAFSQKYLPPFRPSDFGEHLTWLWNRILEQTWFFPWYQTEPGAALSVAHDDPVRVDAVVREMLDSGDAYRTGYGAVLRAPRLGDPDHGYETPLLVTAYDGDPLQDHIDRLTRLPASWTARKVATPAEHQQQSIAWLDRHPAPVPPPVRPMPDRGFVRVDTADFDGLIHWQSDAGGPFDCAHIAAPGMAVELTGGALRIDPPGHGLSDDWNGLRPGDFAAWRKVLEAAAGKLGARHIAWPRPAIGESERLFPDLTPDRFGHYLQTGWQVVRAQVMFEPWYAASTGHARQFAPEELSPKRLAIAQRALLRARAARSWHDALYARPAGDAPITPIDMPASAAPEDRQ
ncbi:alpha/beta hydrolase [Sphingosinithalassobacter portus]|uniref:alpha/beta hydrolase n=1 Tax=Stakelama portus TaxID=2676234 RepID=UPI000D6DF6FE|nr:alpha/beta fold hydrolase [Sphingosinithalassobacter portus]